MESLENIGGFYRKGCAVIFKWNIMLLMIIMIIFRIIRIWRKICNFKASFSTYSLYSLIYNNQDIDSKLVFENTVSYFFQHDPYIHYFIASKTTSAI